MTLSWADSFELLCTQAGFGTQGWAFFGLICDIIGFGFLATEIWLNKQNSEAFKINRDQLRKQFERIDREFEVRKNSLESDLHSYLASPLKNQLVERDLNQHQIRILINEKQQLASQFIVLNELISEHFNFLSSDSLRVDREQIRALHLVEWGIGFIFLGLFLQLFSVWLFC